MFRSITMMLTVCAVCSPAFGGLLYFESVTDFEAYNQTHGCGLLAFENFEKNTLGPNQAAVQNEPLDRNPNVSFPDGLQADALSITSNSGRGVTLVTDGFYGVKSSMVGADVSISLTRLTFQTDDYVAVGLDIADFTMGQPCNVGIFDRQGQMIEATVANSGYDAVFFGVVSDVPIGRIEVGSVAFGNELVDNIQMWGVPEPSALTLMVVLGLARVRTLRRRRAA